MQNQDFFTYCESLGFIENFHSTLPPNFFIIFEIARNILSNESNYEVKSVIDDLTEDQNVDKPDRDETIEVNRVENIVPVSDNMEIESFKKVNELKRLIPRELAQDDLFFDMKFFTRELLVQKFKGSQEDKFIPISTSMNENSKEANKFEQKFYILLDRSRSMEKKMRNFYSKFLVTEILRKKKESRSKLFFRLFDSEVGELHKIEKTEDFTKLLEKIMLTSTGGSGTDIQFAISQAVDDINFESDSMKTEILVVTDGISKVDKIFLKKKLGNIKLNVLKIGNEFPKPDNRKLLKIFKEKEIDFDPSLVDIDEIRDQLKICDDNKSNKCELTPKVKRAYRIILGEAEDIFSEIRLLSNKFIEIDDVNQKEKVELTDNILKDFKNNVEELGSNFTDFNNLDDIQDIYKKTVMLKQYLQMYLQSGHSQNTDLKEIDENLSEIQNELLKNKELYDSLIDFKNLHADKKTMKKALNDHKKRKQKFEKQMEEFSLDDLKDAKMKFSASFEGEGKGGLFDFLKIILKKIWSFIKKKFKKKA